MIVEVFQAEYQLWTLIVTEGAVWSAVGEEPSVAVTPRCKAWKPQ